MNLHLLVPSLFWPEPTLSEIYRDLPLPALENLLAKCSCAEDESEGIEAWLCGAFGVAKQQDWPVAPITLLADGTEDIKAESDYWIRADPVHLRIEHDQIVLADSRVFQISPQEAAEFTSLLNRHFATTGDEIEFLPLRADRWYLRARKTPPATTHLLSEAANKGINELLPSGMNDTLWRSLFNEVQMVLHEHPLNQAREARGQPAINGTWFWGGGIMPESLSSPYTRVWSNDVLSGSLAMACDTDHAQLPPGAAVWQQSATGRQSSCRASRVAWASTVRGCLRLARKSEGTGTELVCSFVGDVETRAVRSDNPHGPRREKKQEFHRKKERFQEVLA